MVGGSSGGVCMVDGRVGWLRVVGIQVIVDGSGGRFALHRFGCDSSVFLGNRCSRAQHTNRKYDRAGKGKSSTVTIIQLDQSIKSKF